MASLQHAQLKTYAGKLSADNSVQRNARASDRQAFENALKQVKCEKSEKIDNVNGSLNSSGFVFNSDEQEDWYRYTHNTVTSGSEFQSAEFVYPSQVTTESDIESGTSYARDFNSHYSDDSSIGANRLDEVSNCLDELLDRDNEQAGSWTFEFETDDAQLVKLQLCCQEDGQWSACMNLDTTLKPP